MSQRRLKRQLNLLPVVMLGTAGAISAEIFVLTGYAAGMAGPATVLALLVGGLLTYSVALNYCEMATAYPEAGGAMTYVREAYGANLLSFLVGSMDCVSSTFYSALSAVGFAYSLQIFAPMLPVIPTALAVVAVFTLLNVLGVSRVGNTQIALGGLLLLIFASYVAAAFLRPNGFQWEVFVPQGKFFIHEGAWTNLSKILATIALLYTAYVGFEVIADDAEEIKDPNRNIPRGILISLTLCMVIYISVATATLGTISWAELAGSTTVLTDVAQRLMPGWGAPLMAMGGLIATLTSINTAMLSGTREAFTLSRNGFWPRFLSHLSRFRTPDAAILLFGVITALITVVGSVDFLSYISSSGYLFVLFWASLAMIRLRKLYPDLKRPFKAPLFPLTAYLAAGSGFLIVAFTHWRALLFGAGVLAAFSVFYALYRPLTRLVVERIKALEAKRDRLLVVAAHAQTAESLVRLAILLGQASQDTSICVLTVVPVSPRVPLEIAGRLVAQLGTRQKALLSRIAQVARIDNVPLYTKLQAAHSVPEGILSEVQGNVKLVLMGWPGSLDAHELAANPAKVILQKAHANVGVLLDRGLRDVRRILVPVGGGPHSRLAIRLAYEIGEHTDAQITALHCFGKLDEVEELEDRMIQLREVIEEELGSVPDRFITRLAQAEEVSGGILAEAAHHLYDLIVVGASEEWVLSTRLFGSIDDEIVREVACSTLLVRRHESATIAWIKYRLNGSKAQGR